MFVSEALNRTGLHVYLTSGGVLLDKNRDSLKFITFFTFFRKISKTGKHICPVPLFKSRLSVKNCIKILSARGNIS